MKTMTRMTSGIAALIAGCALAFPAHLHAAPGGSSKQQEHRLGQPPGDLGKLPGKPRKHRKNHHVFMRSARENADLTKVTLPLYEGVSGGETVLFVVTDASDKVWAERLGVNFAPRLANASGVGNGSQKVNFGPDGIEFPATVDFAPERFLDVGDYEDCAAVPFLPFGDECFEVGAAGNAGYSPLIEMSDGTVLNASHVANSTGMADKVIINDDATVDIDLTEGRAFGKVVYYISLDVSVPPGAVLENATFASRLGDTPSDPDGENAGAFSSRAGIVAFTNGQTGPGNPDRQGLNSTILDGLVPLNILQDVPNLPGDRTPSIYSPLWDVHFTTWQVDEEDRILQSDFEEVRHHADITDPSGGPFSPSGPVANCPIISIDL